MDIKKGDWLEERRRLYTLYILRGLSEETAEAMSLAEIKKRAGVEQEKTDIKEKHTGHCNTPDGFFIPCSDKKCKWYAESEEKKIKTEERFEKSTQMMVDYGICKTIEEARENLKASLKRIGKEEIEKWKL